MALGLKRKRGGGTQQKMDSKLSHQGKCYSAIAQCFIYSSSFPSFGMFRDEHYLQMMNTVARENAFKISSIYHLKVHVNAEYNAFTNATKKAVTEHYEEGHKMLFFIFYCSFMFAIDLCNTSK